MVNKNKLTIRAYLKFSEVFFLTYMLNLLSIKEKLHIISLFQKFEYFLMHLCYI